MFNYNQKISIVLISGVLISCSANGMVSLSRFCAWAGITAGRTQGLNSISTIKPQAVGAARLSSLSGLNRCNQSLLQPRFTGGILNNFEGSQQISNQNNQSWCGRLQSLFGFRAYSDKRSDDQNQEHGSFTEHIWKYKLEEDSEFQKFLKRNPEIKMLLALERELLELTRIKQFEIEKAKLTERQLLSELARNNMNSSYWKVKDTISCHIKNNPAFSRPNDASLFDRERMSTWEKSKDDLVEGYWALYDQKYSYGEAEAPASLQKDYHEGQYPVVKANPQPMPDQDLFLKKLHALERIAELNVPHVREFSPSRFENRALGSLEFIIQDPITGKRIHWPDAFGPYYVRSFNVRPSREFYDFVMNYEISKSLDYHLAKAKCDAFDFTKIVE